MRKEITFYVEADVERVYRAYLTAAAGEPFRRICNGQPMHTITFDLNFSVKYNISGGYCTIRLMPYGKGTAVHLHFLIRQAFGGQGEQYACDLTNAVYAILPVTIYQAAIDPAEFLRPWNQITPETVHMIRPRSDGERCPHCGTPLSPNAAFCTKCGAKIVGKALRKCPVCQYPLIDGESVCRRCGTDTNHPSD